MTIVTIITLIQILIKGKCFDVRGKPRGKKQVTGQRVLLSQLWKSRHGELASESLNLFSYLFYFHLVLLTLGQRLLELLQRGFGVHACLDLDGERNA